jgi:prophage regulatory protein
MKPTIANSPGLVATVSPVRERLLRLPEVEMIVGFRKSTIYAAVLAGTFPAPLKCGARMVAWPSSRIDAWVAERIATSTNPGRTA